MRASVVECSFSIVRPVTVSSCVYRWVWSNTLKKHHLWSICVAVVCGAFSSSVVQGLVMSFTLTEWFAKAAYASAVHSSSVCSSLGGRLAYCRLSRVEYAQT